MNTTIFSHGRNIPLVESYKGYNIVCESGTFMVHDPKGDTLFIVCMDDSKSSGRRTFDDKFNNVEGARNHIDWLTR